MVWMVLGIPLTAVMVGGVLLTMSIKSYDGLVVDDYYKHGKEINLVLDRKLNAEKHRLEADIAFDAANNVEMTLAHDDTFRRPDQITFRLMHRTRAGRDESTTLIRYADGVYRGKLTAATDGVWIAQIETADWRIVGNIRLPLNRFSLSAI